MPLLTQGGASQPKIAPLPIWLAAAALILAGAVRYLQQPSFWLDEAFVALSLRNPSPQTIFGPLEAGQLFPRVYLGAIALLRQAFGYHISVLRLLPTLSFAVATALWARLLVSLACAPQEEAARETHALPGRSRQSLPACLLAGALLLGSSFWLDQAIQLKQYTLDVLLALVPFLLDDEFFKQPLVLGKRRMRLALIALPCLVSYTYPLALVARMLGWYLSRWRRRSGTTQKSSLLILAGSLALGLFVVWATDYRFDLSIRSSYSNYWSDCILGSSHNVGGALRLLAKFLWGWHGRQPFVTAGMAPLQILGVYAVVKRLKNSAPDEPAGSWGTRSIGSLVLLAGMILTSVVAGYPICAGRLTLFAQIHTHILAIEGASFFYGIWNKRHVASIILYIFAAVVLFHSGRAYVRTVESEPAENLRPLMPSINTEVAGAIWVHPCSVAQVKSLPDPLPGEVVFGNDKDEPAGKMWVLWSHLGNERCAKSLEMIRSKARSWQTVSEGPGRGLALAEF